MSVRLNCGHKADSMLQWRATVLQDVARNESDGEHLVVSVERVLVPVLDILILLLGVSGQSVVMLILCRRRQSTPGLRTGTRTGTDALLLALSAADLLLLAVLPFHTVAVAAQYWPFGDAACRLVGFMGSACSSASVFTLAALAVTRYLTVVHPTRAYGRLSPRRLTAAAAALWVPACFLAAPQLAFRSVGVQETMSDSPLACFAFLSRTDQLIYSLVHFLVAFLLPLATIAAAYTLIYVSLRRAAGKGRAGGRRSRTPQIERYQSKVTQTSALLVLAFTLCWLPSYGLTLAALAADQGSGATGGSPRYGPFRTFARLMATSSTVMNPILYVLMSQKFRQDLLRLFRRGRRQPAGVSDAPEATQL